MKDKILFFFNSLKERKSMYFEEHSFISFQDFINGTIAGINIFSKKNIFDEFHKWISFKDEKEHSLSWSFFLRKEFPDLNDHQLINMGLDYIISFFESVDILDGDGGNVPN